MAALGWPPTLAASQASPASLFSLHQSKTNLDSRHLDRIDLRVEKERVLLSPFLPDHLFSDTFQSLGPIGRCFKAALASRPCKGSFLTRASRFCRETVVSDSRNLKPF